MSLGAEILRESPVMPCLLCGGRGGWIMGRAAGSHLPTGATRSPRVGFTLRSSLTGSEGIRTRGAAAFCLAAWLVFPL